MESVDVFISGAGPVGLLLAYYLRQTGVSVFIVDAADKASPEFPMYGRACLLNPRSCEIVDQLNLFDDFAQVAFSSGGAFHYKDGERASAETHEWDFIDKVNGTFFNIYFYLRLKYIEDILRKRLAGLGVDVHAPVKLEDFVLDDSNTDDYKVHATCSDSSGNKFQVRAKYIVGADGGRSMVRKIAQIPFEGERREHVDHWVRIDGVVKTNIPEARVGTGSFATPRHGHVLWAPIDHGATRIGYSLTEEMFQKYGMKMTAEQAAFEAAEAVKPFELEFTQIDWHTVYGIHQNIAARYQEKERILLAGDAAHTHSSGSALGMNTGIHDVAGLSWRLAGVLNGWFQQTVLESYSQERLAVANQLIENDKIISKLVAGQKPDSMIHRPEEAYVLLDEAKAKNSTFNTGLGITYAPNMLNLARGQSLENGPLPGHRLFDVLIKKPGISKSDSRLFEVVKNNGKFKVIVLSGMPKHTGAHLKQLRAQVDNNAGQFIHAIDFITIIPDQWFALDEYLDVRTFGSGFWDPEHNSYTNYNIPVEEGALLVVRPDGILGMATQLTNFDLVTDYLSNIVVARDSLPSDMMELKPVRSMGEYLTMNENNLSMPQSAAA